MTLPLPIARVSAAGIEQTCAATMRAGHLVGSVLANLFVRDMPRLSVDLDLVFPEHTVPRAEALKRINEAIRQSVARLKKQGLQTHALASADAGEPVLA